jgi:hypothetical protein
MGHWEVRFELLHFVSRHPGLALTGDGCLPDGPAGKEVHRSRDMLDSGGIVLFEAAGRDCTITVVDYPGNYQTSPMLRRYRGRMPTHRHNRLHGRGPV